MATFTIGPEYGYVILAATSTFLLGFAHTANTGAYRKTAKIAFPNAYAPASDTSVEAHRFNCAQRAHANFIENQMQLVPALLLAGLSYPKTAAAMGGVWSLSRLIYMRGYSQGGDQGKGRYRKGGGIFWLPQLGLMVLSALTGLGLVLGW